MTREEAIRILKNFSLCGVYHQLIHMNDTDSEAISMAIKALEQPEVIRCKDCKHSEFWYRDKRRCFLWHEEGIDVFEDGFCNYAERRENERRKRKGML